VINKFFHYQNNSASSGCARQKQVGGWVTLTHTIPVGSLCWSVNNRKGWVAQSNSVNHLSLTMVSPLLTVSGLKHFNNQIQQ
jgi:hypothetical protein